MTPTGAAESHARPAGPAHSPFTARATALYAALWLAVVIHGWSPLVAESPERRLYYPAGSAERITARDLERAEAIDRTSGLAGTVLEKIFGSRQESLQAAIDIHRDLLWGFQEGGVTPEDPGAPDRVRARLSILLAENSEPEEAHQIAVEILHPPGFAELLGSTYRAPPERPPAESDGTSSTRSATEIGDQFAQHGLQDWYLDRVNLRAASAAHDPERFRKVEMQLAQRGSRWLRNAVSVLATNFALVAAGALLVAGAVGRRGRGSPGVARGPLPAWSFGVGIGVFVRGDFWNRLYFLAAYSLGDIPGIGSMLSNSGVALILQTWGTLFASLPLLWLIHRHLLAPAGQSYVAAFGLDVRRVGALRILQVSLAAIAIDLLGTHALGWASWGLGFYSNWTEGFDEMLVWGDSVQVLLTSCDYIVWAPTMEEIAFRGVLYYSLRHRLGPASAAIATAAFFAGMHFYTLPGFLMTMWSGIVWALALEHVRSLVPGITAHAIYNALYVLGVVLLYR